MHLKQPFYYHVWLHDWPKFSLLLAVCEHTAWPSYTVLTWESIGKLPFMLTVKLYTQGQAMKLAGYLYYPLHPLSSLACLHNHQPTYSRCEQSSWNTHHDLNSSIWSHYSVGLWTNLGFWKIVDHKFCLAFLSVFMHYMHTVYDKFECEDEYREWCVTDSRYHCIQ